MDFRSLRVGLVLCAGLRSTILLVSPPLSAQTDTGRVLGRVESGHTIPVKLPE